MNSLEQKKKKKKEKREKGRRKQQQTKKGELINRTSWTERYIPISIKVGSEKNDAWSMFHSLRCIIVASVVNYVPATSLET